MTIRILRLCCLCLTVALASGCQSSGGHLAAQVTDSLFGTQGRGRMGFVEGMSSGLTKVTFDRFGVLYVHREHLAYQEEFLATYQQLGQQNRPQTEIEDSQCRMAEQYLARTPKPTHPKADSIRPVIKFGRDRACEATETRFAKAKAEKEARERAVKLVAAQREYERNEAERQKRWDAYNDGLWGYTDRICENEANIGVLEGLNQRELKIAERSGYIDKAGMRNRTTAIVYIEEARDKERSAYQRRFGKSFPLSRCQGWTQEAADERQRVAKR